MSAADTAGWLTLAIWLYLAVGRGMFWWMRGSRPECRLPEELPRVVAIVPARDEADVIGASVASLQSQDYPGTLSVVVVDDHSSDGTATLAASAGAVVIAAPPLPPGWTGKLWAVAEGIRHAAELRPDYLLLCDADIVHAPPSLAGLVARAARGKYDIVSYMATLHCRTLAERVLIPAFVFFFFLLYPPAWIRDPRRRTAGAAGGCMLVRCSALEEAGGIAAIRGALIDDCALAALLKGNGGRVWLGLSHEAHSLRSYQGWAEIGAMISRSAFTQLRHSAVLLAGTVTGMVVTYLLPPWLAVRGSLPGTAAFLLMCAVYLPVLRFYRLSPLWAPSLPLTAAFYSAATIHSAIACWRGRGGMWKGRVQGRSQD